MSGSINRLHSTVDGVAHDTGATLNTFSNTINDLQHDTSGTIANVANECVESRRLTVQPIDLTTYLVTNGFYAMMAAFALSIYFYLVPTPPVVRAMIWMIYTSVCLQMLMTHVRNSRPPRIWPVVPNRQAKLQNRKQELEQAIARSKNSSEIVLTGFNLDDDGIRIIITQAINNQQCINLKLVGCQVTASGAEILADVLLSNKTLIQLSLSNNQVGDVGVQFLSNALSTSDNSLKELDLSQNDITDEGAGYLAEMFKANTVLTHLSLSNNRITDQGVQSLVDALEKHNNTLEALSLTENKSITDESVGFLVNVFKQNRSLKKLWINDCNLSEKSQNRLKRAARKDFELTT